MILRYHGYRNWITQDVITDDLMFDYTFGFELEVQRKRSATINCEEMATKLSEVFGELFVFQHDSSIGDGFEIISQPMTWNYFQSNLNKFKKLLDMLNEHNFRSHDGGRCGLHVHVGKRALGLSREDVDLLTSLHCTENIIAVENDKKQQKIILNIQFILERFQQEIYDFSRRNNYQYAKPITELKRLDNGTEIIDRAKITNRTIRGNHINTRDDRYVNLNLQNENTIEFRMFRGTLKWETFYFSINFINNIINMSKVSNNLITFKQLVLTGLKNDKYDACIEYCNTRNIDLENDKVVQLSSVDIKKKKTINKRDLYLRMMTELN